MRHGDRYPNYNAYGTASYYKTATVLVALRGVLGRDVVRAGFREYGRRWQYKHPTPYDFFNTMEDVAGRDLSWFWRTWFFETWKLDQAIDTVTTVGDSLEVVVANRGRAPMPVHLVVTRSEGEPQTVEMPVERLVRRGEAHHRPDRPRAGDQDDRDRPEAGVPGHRAGERGVA